MNSCHHALFQPVILENVLSYTDGLTVIRAAEVCCMWRDVIHSLSKTPKFWKMKCNRDISSDIIAELTSSLYGDWNIDSSNNIDWMKIYKSWLCFKYIRFWPFNTKWLFHNDDSSQLITAIKVSGDCIITGHQNGKVNKWSRYLGFLKFVGEHFGAVTDIALLNFNSPICIEYERVTALHSYVVSTGEDHKIIVASISPHFRSFRVVLNTHSAPTIMVRSYKNLFAVLSKDYYISVWYLSDPSSVSNHNTKSNPNLLSKFRVYPSALEAISFWEAKITGLTSQAQFFEMKNSENHLHGEIVSSCNQVICNLEGIENCRILQGYIWYNNICMWITDQYYFYIALDKHSCKRYNSMETLGSFPVSLLLYGEMFFIGLESGTIVAYHLQNPEDLLNINLACTHWTYTPSNDPVLCMDIADTFSGPVFAASTHSDLYCISFISPSMV